VIDQSAHQAIWRVKAPIEAYDAEKELLENCIYIGFENEDAHTRERMQKLRQAGFTPLFPPGMRFDAFVKAPRLAMVDHYRPDFFVHHRNFVSPKLFALLDQPAGSLQALPTDTEWKGENPPDWSYLWLSYVPTVPAIDLERSGAEVEYKQQEGRSVPRIVGHGERLVLRDDLVMPCGLALAVEGPSTIFATDAVALAVLQAGCTGIEFVEVETAYDRYGPLRRRGLEGVELHPGGVRRRRENRQPVPDA